MHSSPLIIGLFHGIQFLTQHNVSLLLPFIYLVDPYFVNAIDILSLKRFRYFLVFTEEIAFKHFLFTNIKKFSDHTDIKKWTLKIFQRLWGTLNVFRISHTLMRNLTGLCSERKNRELKIFISLSFQGKKSWNLKCKFKYGFSIEKKQYFFIWRKEKKVFWDLKEFSYSGYRIFNLANLKSD